VYKDYDIVVVCGPTASGKSSLAMFIAEAINGSIINADSAQLYKDLLIITASPKVADKSRVEHLLYNFLNLTENFCVRQYLSKALDAIEDVIARGKVPVLVGGSGLYISAVLDGMHALPKVNSLIAESVQSEMRKYGNLKMYEQLVKIDAKFASKIHYTDTYRVSRGLSVFFESGKTFSSFLNAPRYNPLARYTKKIIFLNPERNLLYQLIEERFDYMLDIGALEEIKKIDPMTLHYAKRIIGVKELASYIAQEISYEDALRLAKQSSRRYAKRQITWFANQLKDKYTIRDLKEFKELLNTFEL
jgi:tRNA dimethylallyltransferase